MWMDNDISGNFLSRMSSKLFLSELFKINSTKKFSVDKMILLKTSDFPKECNNW